MAEELRIKNGDKQEMYETLLPQIASLVGNETDLIANTQANFRFLLGGFLPGHRQSVGISAFSRPYRLYTNQIRKRGMRHGLEGDPYDHRTGCRRFPGTYRL